MTSRKLITKRRSLFIVFLSILTVQLSGCAFGFYSYKTTDQGATLPASDLSDVKISYTATQETAITMSLEKTLGKRFSILDIKKIGDSNFQKDNNRFVIRAKLNYEDYSLKSTIWGLVGMFSLATILAIVDRNATATFEVIAPNGDGEKSEYSFTERFYSWLPFIFFGPDIAYVFLGGKDDHEKSDKMLEQICTRFIVEATPFIVSHSKSRSDL